MSYFNRKSNYDKSPVTQISGYEDAGITGYENITQSIKQKIRNDSVIVVDCYPGVNDDEVLSALIEGIKPDYIVKSEDIFYDEETLNKMMAAHLTEDRVRGVMYYGPMSDFVDEAQRLYYENKVKECDGVCLIYGVGASLITKGDLLVYADMARWEIQLRYRKGMSNFKCHNEEEDSGNTKN